MAATFSKLGQSQTFNSKFVQNTLELILCFTIEQTEIHQRAKHRSWPLCVFRTKTCLELPVRSLYLPILANSHLYFHNIVKNWDADSLRILSKHQHEPWLNVHLINLTIPIMGQ